MMSDIEPAPSRTPPWLLALGAVAPPTRIQLKNQPATLAKTFKHDFFAFTARFQSNEGPIVLKVSRTSPLFGIPMKWIGRLLKKQEVRLYRLTDLIEGVPRLVGEYGETGFAHEYVEGRPLSRDDRPADDFFPRLAELLEALHRRSIAYVDLEKPENILVSTAGRPFLFDFQISWYLPPNRGGRTWLARLILRVLQASDRYHLAKHWRKFRPDQFDQLGFAETLQPPIWIRLHRALFRPVTVARRQVLVWLGVRSSIWGRSPG